MKEANYVICYSTPDNITQIDGPFAATNIKSIEGFLRFSDKDENMIRLYQMELIIWVRREEEALSK